MDLKMSVLADDSQLPTRLVLGMSALVSAFVGYNWYHNDWKRLRALDGEHSFYFGFGANMNVQNLTQFKGVKVRSKRRAVLEGFRFSFSVYNKESGDGMGNVAVDETFSFGVHGALVEVHRDEMSKLDAMEVFYRRIRRRVQIYESDGGGFAVATLYLCDENSLKKALSESSYCLKADARGDWNYKATILAGAKQLKLQPYYISFLESLPQSKVLKFDDGIAAKFPEVFTLRKVATMTATGVFKGFVFRLNTSEALTKVILANGVDFTLFIAKRWAFANAENTKDMHSLECAQKVYLNHFLMRCLLGTQKAFLQPLGVLKTGESGSLDSYDW